MDNWPYGTLRCTPYRGRPEKWKDWRRNVNSHGGCKIEDISIPGRLLRMECVLWLNLSKNRGLYLMNWGSEDRCSQREQNFQTCLTIPLNSRQRYIKFFGSSDKSVEPFLLLTRVQECLKNTYYWKNIAEWHSFLWFNCYLCHVIWIRTPCYFAPLR